MQSGSPHQLGHIRLIEVVQCKFTRIIPELKTLTHEARFKKVKSNNIEIRRIRADLNEVHINLNGLEKIHPDSLFPSSRYTNIRCHTIKLEKKQVSSIRHRLQAVELSQRTHTAVQIVSNLPAPVMGARLTVFGHSPNGRRCCSQKRVMSRPSRSDNFKQTSLDL